MTKSSMLVRVLSVRAQNRRGAIFRGQQITEEGQIVDAQTDVIACVQADAIGVKVMDGQWWKLSGVLSDRTFINSGGFQMTEAHLDVGPGDAALRLPAGTHIVDYLSRRFKGVGSVTATTLWETFKQRLVDVLDQGDYQAMVDVISPEKTKLIIEGWQAEGLSKTLQWLQSHGVGLAIGRRILGYYGAEAMDKIAENPYRLLSFSAGWNEIDRLALDSFRLSGTDERRLGAAVEEVVYKAFSRGDTYVPRPQLREGVKALLRHEPLTKVTIERAIDAAEASRRLLFDRAGNAYSLGASILENRVVDAIGARLTLTSPPCDVDAVISGYEGREGFRLNAEQVEAVRMAAKHHIGVITGGAGCGKTTVLKAVCEVLEDQKYEIVQLALAGKAVKRMQESTGRPARTLAAFLSSLKKGLEVDLQASTAKQRAILIDEASMVDLLSFSGLVHQISVMVKLVLIGDPHQLPPVGPGLVFHCLTTGCVPHVELKVAKRFGSEIGDFANAVRDGRLPALSTKGKVRFMEMNNTQMPEAATDLYLSSPHDTVVLTTTRAMARTINQVAQEKVGSGRAEVRVWNEEFDCYEASGLRDQDLVICTKNHWDLGLQNGSIGRIVKISQNIDSALGAIEWDDGEVRAFGAELLDSLELAYALTVHKSQGSQWQRVIVCLPTGGRLTDRSLVYTAVTRAQSEVVILGSATDIAAAVKAEKAADRRLVGLHARLKALSAHKPVEPVAA